MGSGFRRKDGEGNAGKTGGNSGMAHVYVEALRLFPACWLVRLYRSRELRAHRFVHMGHTEYCLFVEGPSGNL